LRQAMAQARRRKQLLGVACFDLDAFKAINDGYGHSSGDAMLTALAFRMKRALRKGDTLARLGGDEFAAVILDLPDSDACLPTLTRILEAAAKEAGAEKLESGLVFKDVTPGTGASPVAADTVKVNYRGTLIDGTEFDSSYKRNQPAEFPLGGVIKCWTEGVQKMKVGGKARLVCPSAIAYGDGGHPPTIPGGATLIFEVELLEIKGK